jgi:hypothetical protein
MKTLGGSTVGCAEKPPPFGEAIQEQILFLPPIKGLNERSPQPIVSRIDWDEQRRLFQERCNCDCPPQVRPPYILLAAPTRRAGHRARLQRSRPVFHP